MTASSSVAMVSETYAGTCPQHGDFTGDMVLIGETKVRKGCPACLRERTAERLEREAREAERANAERAIAATAALRKAGVPLRFEGKTLESYSATLDGQRKALAAARALVDAIREGRTAPNVILAGKPGTGKSHLCCGIVLELYGTHKVCRIDLPDLIREIRATWRRDAERSEEDVLDHYGTLDLLILEEVGTGAGSDDERARIFQVINRRYEAMLPTVVVTNLGLAELKAEMGERVIDRLREGDRSYVAFDWESQRGAA